MNEQRPPPDSQFGVGAISSPTQEQIAAAVSTCFDLWAARWVLRSAKVEASR
jgi:hypothetical protein